MEIILCRHTRTADNFNRIYSGQNDVELDEVGWEQAVQLTRQVAQLPSMPIGAVLSSDLIRAKCLAELIGAQIGVMPVVDASLREVNIGQMAGLVREDALREFPAERHKTVNPHFDFTDIGGESADDVCKRHLGFLSEEVEKWRAKGARRIIVVGHGTSLRLVFQYTLGAISQLHRQGEYQLIKWRYDQAMRRYKM